MNVQALNPNDGKDHLINLVRNNKGLYDHMHLIVNSIKSLGARAAMQAAKANAEWHDDPEGDPEGYERYHAPADVQFPESVRNAAMIELLQYYLETEG